MNKLDFIKKNELKIQNILFLVLFLLCWRNIDDFGVSIDDEIYYLNGVNTYEYIKHFFLSFNNKDINLQEYRNQLKEVEKRAKKAYKENRKTIRNTVKGMSDSGISKYKKTYTKKY